MLPPERSVERPQYILQLDDLPKVIQANGTVTPVYMNVREVSRLFSLTSTVVLEWAKRYEWPVLQIEKYYYVPVQFVCDWIAANTRLFRESDTEDDLDGADCEPPSEGPA